MFAHVDQTIYLVFLPSLAIGNLAALVTLIGLFRLRQRQDWLLTAGGLAIVCGTIATAKAASWGQAHLILIPCLAPVAIGGLALIRWKRLQP